MCIQWNPTQPTRSNTAAAATPATAFPRHDHNPTEPPLSAPRTRVTGSAPSMASVMRNASLSSGDVVSSSALCQVADGCFQHPAAAPTDVNADSKPR